MSEMMIIWLVVLILSVGIEMATLGLASIWFSGGALVALIASAFHAPVAVQILLFFTVSLILLIFTRPIAVKYFNKDRVKTNAESLVGKQAIVLSEIDNIQGIGQVLVAGQEWSARCADDGIKLAAGSVVEIVAISGVKLIVKEAPQMELVNGGMQQPTKQVSIEPEED